MSAEQHREAAAADERQAAVQQAASDEAAHARLEDRYRCPDRPPAWVATSGGQPIEIWRPCWTAEKNPSLDQAKAADAHRREAERHRQLAAALVTAEEDSCKGIGEDEIAHSPFFHHDDIVAVTPVQRGQDIVGARIVFRPVAGLTAAWLSHALACHHARAAVLGFPPTFQPYCPMSVPDVSFKVAEGPTGLVVTLTTSSATSAATVWGRAQALLDPAAAPH
jgi:hypothetical protein